MPFRSVNPLSIFANLSCANITCQFVGYLQMYAGEKIFYIPRLLFLGFAITRRTHGVILTIRKRALLVQFFTEESAQVRAKRGEKSAPQQSSAMRNLSSLFLFISRKPFC
ncbi:hypothetical protein POVWA2_047290 [Plasmodium ovale wallikeri]|uniref:Uncharacterized protein n=1 Tax=Plasmodium ovale wallikeri TaxID=864142 RepID=A0A1A8ZJQ2_PLAOA|nr:hypothetical protein POVWA1_029660 [Plasmodium ovale wallikeri]SBT44083.1 hypothetical protein POVWA2_047290 [Plasmodium ovale wallikeri]